MVDPQANLPDCAHSAKAGAVPCDLCVLNHLCEPLADSGDTVTEPGPVGGRQIRLKRGDVLFRKGDGFKTVYALSRGSIKLAIPKESDEEQVMGFRIAGELVGVNGMGAGENLSDAVALEDTEVCALCGRPFGRQRQRHHLIPRLKGGSIQARSGWELRSTFPQDRHFPQGSSAVRC